MQCREGERIEGRGEGVGVGVWEGVRRRKDDRESTKEQARGRGGERDSEEGEEGKKEQWIHAQDPCDLSRTHLALCLHFLEGAHSPLPVTSLPLKLCHRIVHGLREGGEK